MAQNNNNPYYSPVNTDDYLNALKDRKDSQKSLYDLYYNQNMYDMNAQKPMIKNTYDSARGQAYTGARVSALGNNEAMANMGLAGNAYTAPRSGYSETSRVRQDVSMQNELGALSQEQRGAMQRLQEAISRSQMQRTADMTDINAQYQQQVADTQKWAEQENYQRQLTASQQLAQEEQRQIPYIKGIIESGATLGETQEALLAKYTGMTSAEYKKVLETQREREKEGFYQENFFNLMAMYNQDGASFEDAEFYYETGMISEKQFNTFKSRYEKEVASKRTNDLNNILQGGHELPPEERDAFILQTLEQIDRDFEKGFIAKADREKAYYDVAKSTVDKLNASKGMLESPVRMLDEYNALLGYLETIEEQLGDKNYNALVSELEAVYKKSIEPKQYSNERITGAGPMTNEQVQKQKEFEEKLKNAARKTGAAIKRGGRTVKGLFTGSGSSGGRSR